MYNKLKSQFNFQSFALTNLATLPYDVLEITLNSHVQVSKAFENDFSIYFRYLLINIIMTPLYTTEEFNLAKGKDLLPCQCHFCKKIFYKLKSNIQLALSPNHTDSGKYCSKNCYHNSMKIEKVSINCLNCNIIFYKSKSKLKKYPNSFCSKSCSASYTNKHKSTGYKRSKLEIYLEEQLTLLYPNLQIDYNKKDAIGSELDIYIPSLNLAFELNGIFHYEPIYGINKLNQIKNNDTSKSKACHDAKIDLCIIDTSPQKYVKPSTSKKYFDIINNIIKERLSIT